MREYKLVVLHSSAVGGLALTAQFVQGIFAEGYGPSIENLFQKQVEVDGQQCMLDILVPAANDQFTVMRDLYMKNGQGFVLVYSITSQSSFDYLGDFRDQLIKVKGTSDIPMVLVGNKCDLEEERIVGKDQGQALAEQFGNCTFLETSAKTNTNVTETFFDLVRQINRKTPEEKPEVKKKERRKRALRRCVLL